MRWTGANVAGHRQQMVLRTYIHDVAVQTDARLNGSRRQRTVGDALPRNGRRIKSVTSLFRDGLAAATTLRDGVKSWRRSVEPSPNATRLRGSSCDAFSIHKASQRGRLILHTSMCQHQSISSVFSHKRAKLQFFSVLMNDTSLCHAVYSQLDSPGWLAGSSFVGLAQRNLWPP